MIPLATLTKAHIVENLLAKNLFTKRESAQIVETLFELLRQSLEEGDDVLISGFGKFCVREKSRRRGRNPQSGEPMMATPQGGHVQLLRGITGQNQSEKRKTADHGNQKVVNGCGLKWLRSRTRLRVADGPASTLAQRVR